MVYEFVWLNANRWLSWMDNAYAVMSVGVRGIMVLVSVITEINRNIRVQLSLAATVSMCVQCIRYEYTTRTSCPRLQNFLYFILLFLLYETFIMCVYKN